MNIFNLNKQPINTDDEKLLADYRLSGDLHLLGLAYEKYMTLVYGVCLKYYRNEEKSKDAVMQIFEELIIKVKKHEIKNFKSWLHVLTRNHCLMDLRKKQKINTFSIDALNMENEILLHHDYTELKEIRLNTMEKCMETLSTEQRASIHLFYLKQKCYGEVALETGFEINKVKSYIQNGKRNLKICIEKNIE